MILVGNARGGAKDLALHLMKEENDHVEIHELKGFAADTLMDALRESYAVSRGTRCRKHLYSLSLNPPPDARVSTAEFEAAIERAEERLGLSGQPRAIVFHEKEGRRHAHAVWSRIKTDEMKAVHLFRDHEKLRTVSRELHLQHGWQMPRGLMDSKLRDPRNFSLAEWQQAKRAGIDPREVKATIQECWAVSDSRASFEVALRERGLRLARGDQRGFVALDHQGEAYAVYRWAVVKAKNVAARLGDASTLPSADEAKRQIAQEMGASLDRLRREYLAARQAERAAFDKRRAELIERQRTERAAAFEAIEKRQAQESIARQQRFRFGVGGLWDRLRGEHARIRKQNEAEAYAALLRDRREKDALIFHQLQGRAELSFERRQEVAEQKTRSLKLSEDRERYRKAEAQAVAASRQAFREKRGERAAAPTPKRWPTRDR